MLLQSRIAALLCLFEKKKFARGVVVVSRVLLAWKKNIEAVPLG